MKKIFKEIKMEVLYPNGLVLFTSYTGEGDSSTSEDEWTPFF